MVRQWSGQRKRVVREACGRWRAAIWARQADPEAQAFPFRSWQTLIRFWTPSSPPALDERTQADRSKSTTLREPTRFALFNRSIALSFCHRLSLSASGPEAIRFPPPSASVLLGCSSTRSSTPSAACGRCDYCSDDSHRSPQLPHHLSTNRVMDAMFC